MMILMIGIKDDKSCCMYVWDLHFFYSSVFGHFLGIYT